MAETMDPHTAEKLGLPKPTTIKLINGEIIKGTLTMVKPKRIVVDCEDGRTLKIFKHSIVYYED
ncbi:hypothetical protein LPAF129_02410 [Ligilactobacillus pabuli]|uniref:Uncharacterized protein n=1 Tax=Ligilactobacillus pabuli TaxID=2886039 RepID=A0ABQ5JER3_9LACO|nr:hypothetical protein [Ligilactobacillus pabuli]GKS80556.1 hypothetical protein LPAF129_02410 [Ligilactobacillus pabuli]HIW89363.1 hypothetical protein [Candidatus Ligilactobacillus excrementipullorum]